jgi:hypothetical protein
VCWREGSDSGGWAPLPPGASFKAGLGWIFNGRAVTGGFGFLLPSDAFTFVHFDDLTSHYLPQSRLPRAETLAIFEQSRVRTDLDFASP